MANSVVLVMALQTCRFQSKNAVAMLRCTRNKTDFGAGEIVASDQLFARYAA